MLKRLLVAKTSSKGPKDHISNGQKTPDAVSGVRGWQCALRGANFERLSAGKDALRGADIISTVTGKYSSNIEYATNSFAKSMKGAAQILQADIGTRICYTQHGSFDAHTNGIALQESLLRDVSGGIYDFYSDMKEHNQGEDVLIFAFSEFGRRVKDNGNGTDHGSGGVAFLIGDGVKGGHYNEYPSLDPDKLIEGDLAFNFDFRGLYTEILEDWLEVDAKPVVKGTYETVNALVV